MIPTIQFEMKRVFHRSSCIVFLVITIASLFFTHMGVQEYRRFIEDKTALIAGEAKKAGHCMDYKQYGVMGIRILLEPSPLVVFFNRNSFALNVETFINTTQTLPTFSSRKGKDAFQSGKRFGDLGQCIAVFGSLLMLFFGFNTVPNRYVLHFLNRRNLLKTTIVRLLLLGCFFITLFVLNYGYARMMGINFSSGEQQVISILSIISLLFLSFFFLAGMAIKAIFQYKKRSIVYMLIAWFIFVFVLPGLGNLVNSIGINSLPSVEKLHLGQWELLLDAEKEHREILLNMKHEEKSLTDREKIKSITWGLVGKYMKNGYKDNQKMEMNLLDKVQRQVRSMIACDYYSPVGFYLFLSAEASGAGPIAYLDFQKYIITQKDRFIKYILKERYRPGVPMITQVKPFVTGSENVYKATVNMNSISGKGTLLLIIYNLIVIAILILLHRKKNSIEQEPGLPGNIKTGNILFLLANPDKQDELYASFKQKNWSFLGTESHLIPSFDVKGKTFINFVCRETGISQSTVIQKLESLDFQQETLNKSINQYGPEEKQKVIAAIALASDKPLVINDFLLGVSREFEKQFLQALARETQDAENRRTIVYISRHLYEPASSLTTQPIQVENYQSFMLEPLKVSLR